MKKILFLVAVAVAAVSCSTQMATYSAKTANVPYSLKAVPTTAELDVADTKVMAEVKDRKGMLKKNAEDWAVSEALNKVSADILLEPRFEYTYNKSCEHTRKRQQKLAAQDRIFRGFPKL